MNWKIMLGVTALVASMSLGVACSSDEEAPPPPPKPAATVAAPAPTAPPVLETLDIGYLGVESGPAAAWGIPFKIAMEIAADETTDEGGLLVGGKRYRINFETSDTKYEIPNMLSVVQKFVSSDGKKFIVDIGDPIIGAIDPITGPAKVIHTSITWDMGPPTTNPYTFATQATPRETYPILLRYVKDNLPEVQSLLYLAINFRFDLNAADWAEEAADEIGGFEWLGVNVYDAGTTDFLPVANGIKAKNPDMVLLGTVGGDGAAIVRSLRDMGYDGPMGSAFAAPSTAQLVDAFEGELEYIEGYLAVEEPVTRGLDPDLDALIDAYEARSVGTGVAPYGLGVAYYTVKVLLQAIQDAGTVDDTDAIARAFQDVSISNKFYPGDPVMTMGGVEKLGGKKQLQQPMPLNVIRDGEVVNLGVFIATVN